MRLRVGVADPSRETGVAFAYECLRGVENAVAFARSYVPGVETGVAFAGENRLVLACFSVAVVLSVSTVAVQGRAVVTAVSCWPASVAAVVSLVAKSPRRRVWRVKKFAQPTKNAPKMAFYGLPGELFRGNTDGAVALGEFCRGLSGGEGVLGEFCRACRPATATGPGSATGPVPAAILCGASVPPHRRRWGFCSIRSWLAGYLRRVAALMMQFPPFGGDELAVCGGVVAKLQTHWVKRLQKRLVLAEWVCTLADSASVVVCCSHTDL